MLMNIHFLILIILKGQWLKEAGFNFGDYVEVVCDGDKITLVKTTPHESKSSSKEVLEEKINNMSESKRRKLSEMIDKL